MEVFCCACPSECNFLLPIFQASAYISISSSLQVAASKGGAVLSSLASGTFLYVAIMEVIPKELEENSMRLAKMAAIFVGFGAMSVLAIWA
jgi:hypothetical protein